MQQIFTQKINNEIHLPAKKISEQQTVTIYCLQQVVGQICKNPTIISRQPYEFMAICEYFYNNVILQKITKNVLLRYLHSYNH